MRIGIVLLGHGSRRNAANAELKRLSELVRALLGMDVRPAFFQFSRPSLQDAIEGFVEDGIRDVLVVPAFLFPGVHLKHDLPEALQELRDRLGPGLRLRLAPCLGSDPRLAEVIADRVRTAIGSVPDLHVKEATGGELTDPDAITSSSRLLIEESLGRNFFRERFSESEGEVVRRVVHAMGNPSVASLMRFHPDAVAVGVAALRRGALIFTDVQMVKIGINKGALRELGGRAVCLIRHPEVCRIAREEGLTRALVAVRISQDLWRGQIVVVGNAPTALREVIRLSSQGIRPALIIGTPVGFVGAAEAKALLASQDVPYITLLGNQGGSTAAVAVVNALLALALGRAGL